MTKSEIEAESLDRARSGQTMSNYPAIFAGLMVKGIPECEIKPRENVFTFNAWKALGRSVKKGEHGVKVVTFIERNVTERDPSTGEQVERSYRSPHTTTVFHISQTETTEERDARLAATRPLGAGPLDWPREKRLRHARKVRDICGPRRSFWASGHGRYPAIDYPDPAELAADRWNETHGDR
jgi:hypothetical protein